MRYRYHAKMLSLKPHETIEFDCVATRVSLVAPSIVGITGKLVVTSDRLIFLPTRFTFALWAGYTDTVELPLEEVVSVKLNGKRSWMERTNRTTAVFIEMSDGSRWRFDAHRAMELVAAIDETRSGDTTLTQRDVTT